MIGNLMEASMWGFKPFQFKPLGTPFVFTVLTFLLMLGFLTISALNKIAQLSSIFFLLSYLTVNLACLFLEWASAPNFRPKFRGYGILTCCIGTVGCASMMFVVNPLFALIALVGFLAVVGIFMFTVSPEMSKEWGSIGKFLKTICVRH